MPRGSLFSSTGLPRLLAGAAVLFALTGGQVALAQPAAAGHDVTFTKDVVPILQRSCQICHRPGAIAPMSLVTYEDVRPWARSIKRYVEAREMPPWYIDRRIGIQEFKDDPSLTDEEIATVASLGRRRRAARQPGRRAAAPWSFPVPRTGAWASRT